MKVGFTGTSIGMTNLQQEALKKILTELKPEELHHGDCEGSDEQAHYIALSLKIQVVVHPPENPYKRAFCKDFVSIRVEKPYLERNQEIVKETEILIATPKNAIEELRSGTWATIRFAKKQKKHWSIIEPNGKIRTP